MNRKKNNKHMSSKLKMQILYGLPASGKSTYAYTLVDQGWVRTNKDTIRLDNNLFPKGYKHSKGNEKKVIKERDRIIKEALSLGKNVVVDDTNLNPLHTRELTNIAKQFGAEVEFNNSFLDVPLNVCIERDSKRTDKDKVGEQVIRKMFHQYIKVPKTALKYDPTLPLAVICDLDGTLCDMDGKRGPYEWKKVGGDKINEGVSHLLDAIYIMGYAKIFLFSGRDEICRPETEEWLERHDIEYESLYMRRSNHLDENGNQIKDTVVKEEMIRKYIVGKYNILFWVDDRPVICRMLRDKYGINVFQVGDPHYEF